MTAQLQDSGSELASPTASRLALNNVVVTERTRESLGSPRGLELLILAAEHRRGVFLITTACTLLGLLTALLIPPQFTAVTQLMPPQQNKSSVSAALGQLGDLAALVGKDAVQSSSAIFVSLLHSDTVADRLIVRFNLMTVYQTLLRSRCRAALGSRTEISSSKQGVISIRVRDWDPARAAALANAYVDELFRMNQTLAIGEAAQRRLFFETQLENARTQLHDSEEALKATQKTTGIIQLDAQGKTYAAADARLRSMIANAEAELVVIQDSSTSDNFEYKKLNHVIKTLNNKLDQRNKNDQSEQAQITTSRMADSSLEYLRKLREVKYREAVFEALAKQLEVARIDEAKSAALIQVIDRAEAPDRKSDPSRALITLTGTVLGLGIACLWIGGKQVLSQWQSDPIIRQQLESLKGSLLPRWSLHSGAGSS